MRCSNTARRDKRDIKIHWFQAASTKDVVSGEYAGHRLGAWDLCFTMALASSYRSVIAAKHRLRPFPLPRTFHSPNTLSTSIMYTCCFVQRRSLTSKTFISQALLTITNSKYARHRSTMAPSLARVLWRESFSSILPLHSSINPLKLEKISYIIDFSFVISLRKET